MSKDQIDEINMMAVFLEDPSKRGEILNNAGNNYLSPENKEQRKFLSEVAGNFNNIKKEEINLLSEGSQAAAKMFKDFFISIQNHSPQPINSQTIISSIEIQDTKALFNFFQKAAEVKIFDKLLSFTPEIAQKSEQFKFNKVFIEQVKLQKTPEKFKIFLISHLKDPKNKEMMQILSRDLKIALETPGIKKLVDIVTDPKSIKAASILINSRASRNLSKVLAKENPSKIELAFAGARLFATAIRLAPISKIISATAIILNLNKRLNAEAVKDYNNLVAQDMIKRFKISAMNSSSSANAFVNGIPNIVKSSSYHRK